MYGSINANNATKPSENFEISGGDNNSTYYVQTKKTSVVLKVLIYSLMLALSGSIVIYTYSSSTSAIGIVAEMFGWIPDSGSSVFKLSSVSFKNLGQYPFKFTCSKGIHGSDHSGTDTTLGISPSLFWTNTPVGTKSFALFMETLSTNSSEKAPKFSWILYDISSDVTSIAENTTVGTNSITDIHAVYQKNGYARPCSAGEGARWYFFNIYALDDEMINILPKDYYYTKSLTAAEMLVYMFDHVLENATLSTWYRRY